MYLVKIKKQGNLLESSIIKIYDQSSKLGMGVRNLKLFQFPWIKYRCLGQNIDASEQPESPKFQTHFLQLVMWVYVLSVQFHQLVVNLPEHPNEFEVKP